MQRLTKFAPALFILVFIAALVGACAPAKPKEPVEVKVTVKEFHIESSLTEFQVGVPYHFVVTNAGTVTHEFLIAPSMGDMTMEELDAVRLGEISEDDLPAGATATLDLTFTEPAQLELSCHVPGHYEDGMKLPITIK